MTKVEEFSVLYHSIGGETIKDKRKHLNDFLKSLKSGLHSEEDLNTFVKLIAPKTALEEIFRIDVLIELKRKDILLQELKSCNGILVKKLLKDWKLFGEIFSAIDADDLVNNILSHLSYSLKLKVLNGIRKNLKNEDLLDEYFVMLQRKYGLKIATLILPGCSIGLIKSTISTYHFKLSKSHLKRILKKNELFVEYYFDEIKKKYENINFSVEYRSALQYIAKMNPDLYWKLCERHQLKIRFGKHTTSNMLKSHNIMGKGNQVFETFHFLQMYKTMKKRDMLNEFLLSLYPETHDKFSETFLQYNLFRFIEKGPRTERYNLISTCFSQKYNKKLLDYHNYFTEDLLKITPLKEREQILDIKVKENENLFYLYGTTTSVPLFKERLQHTSNAKKRAKQLIYLYESCAINKDEKALLDILRYILSRHKNDTNFLPMFLNNLIYWPDIINLSEQHWQYILDIAKTLEISRSRHWNDEPFYEKYIYHLIKNNKSCSKVVKDLIKDAVENRKYSFDYVHDNKYQNCYWEEVAKCIDTYQGHDKYSMLCIKFLSIIVTYKTKNTPKLVLNYRRFINQIDINEWPFSQVITSAITCDEEVIHNLFWNSDVIDYNSLRWYMKHRPDKIKENIDKVLSSLKSLNLKRFLRDLKMVLDPDTVQKLKTHALDNIHNENYEEAKVFVKIISVLSPEAFLELTTPLLPPSDGKIDLEKSASKITLQRTVAKGLANIRDPLVSFPLILKFCVGDYLKFGLPGLYSITYNTPELYLKDFLSKLSKKAVSARKHVLHLGRYLLSAEDFYELLKGWSETEKVLSMSNIIMRKTLEYFIENPSDHFWILLKINLNTLDKSDRELYNFLLKFQTFPRAYLPEYLEIIYKLMANNTDAEINKKKFQLIDNIPVAFIDKLKESFVKEVIRETLCVVPVSNFHWKCVFYTTGEKQLRLFEENFQTFGKYVDKNNFDMRDVAIRSKVSNFVTQFYYLALELKQGGDLIQKFISSWISVFKPQNFNREFMLIQFANLYFNSEFDAYETGLKINRLLYDYIGKFNSSVVHPFCRQLHNFILQSRIKYEEKNLFKFIEGLFQNKNDGNIYTAVMYFLPKATPKSDDACAKYISILDEIENCGIPLVQYYFDSYLSGNKFK